VPMRKLNWSKVPDIKVKGTIWESEATDDSEASRLDGGELEALFGAKPKDKDAAGAEGAPSARERKGSTAVSQVALVDSKRAQQISTILGNLRSMHLSQEVVLGALLEADLGRLDNPRMPVEMVLSILVSSMPQPDEIEAIEGYVLEGPREALRDVETWLLLVKEGLPSYLKRTTALQARASFHEAHGEALGLSSRVLSTARQIRGSATLQRLLSMTLAIGNYLNGTSRTGGAYGFKLNVLADLASTKTVDGKSTLLHYLASKTATLGKGGGPLVADLRGELAELDDPVRFEWSVLSAEIAALSKGVTSIKQLITSDKNEKFVASMGGFHSSAEAKMLELDGISSETTAVCVDLGKWFAFEKVDKEPEKFFALIGTFVRSLEQADRFNTEAAEREEKKKKRAERAAKEAEERKAGKAGAKGAKGGALADVDIMRHSTRA